MKVGQIIAAIEQLAPPELQEDYDNAGLLIGDKDQPCTGVLCSLDATAGVVEEALQYRCNLIIVHHPVIFKGVKKLNGSNYTEKVVIKAIKNDVAIYAAHTNLDNILSGVNAAMAKKLSLINCTVLQPKYGLLRKLITFAPTAKAEEVRKALFAAGAGHVGRYSECSFNTEGTGTFKAEAGADPYVGEVGKQHREAETKIEMVYPFYNERQVVKALAAAHPYEEVAYDIFTMENSYSGIGAGLVGELESPMAEDDFLKKLKEAFGLRVIRHTAVRNRPVKKVALCGGAGSFLIKKAVQRGADAYVTADVKYHEFFDAEGKLVLADIGHYESEQATVDLLYDLLVEKFPTFAVLKTRLNTNPVQYYM